MPKVSEAYLEARRQEILGAAIACFTRKGFHQTTMDDIYEEVGLSPGAVYHYFASKEEIIQAAMRESSQTDSANLPDFLRWIEEEVTRFDDFVKLMNMFNRLWYQRMKPGEQAVEIEFKLRLRAWAEALQNPEVKKDILSRWEHRLSLFEEVVRRAQELGQINPDLDPGAAARILLAIAEGSRLLWTLDPDFDAWKWKFNEVEMALYSGNFWCDDG